MKNLIIWIENWISIRQLVPVLFRAFSSTVCLLIIKKFSLFLKFTFLYHITESNETRLGLRAHGVVSERFHSELFQKAPDLLTKFNGNSNREPRLWTISQ